MGLILNIYEFNNINYCKNKKKFFKSNIQTLKLNSLTEREKDNELITLRLPEKNVQEIVKEMSDKRLLNEIKQYEKEFGIGGITDLMRPL